MPVAGHPGVPLTPEQIATRLDNLARGRLRRKPENLAALAVEIAGMSLAEIASKTPARYLTVATYHVMGLNNVEIARILGYAQGSKNGKEGVRRALARPDVKALVDGIKAAQLERVISGEFGVQAAAKAAAPKVTRRLIEKAGAVEDTSGRPVGMAHRDADAIRASETVLRLSGDLTEKRESVHLHLLGQLDPAELRRFADEGVWPARFRHLQEQLEGPAPLDVTE